MNESAQGTVVEPAQIVSVEATAGTDVPTDIGGPLEDLPIVWIVHAYGTFFNEHGPVHHLFNEGYYFFDDNGRQVGDALLERQPTLGS